MIDFEQFKCPLLVDQRPTSGFSNLIKVIVTWPLRSIESKQSTFDVKDTPRTGRLIIENVDKISVIIKVDRHVSSRRIAQELKIDHKTVLKHLRKSIYCQQLDRLKLAIDQKWLEFADRIVGIFHQDNARPNTSVVTRQKLWELGWGVLMHPPYSPNLAPSDYHLFLALQNFLSDKKLGSREDRLLEFFANKDQNFYERRIMKLPLKWQQIIQQNGAYLSQIGQSETC
ncbi:histone-lysine N-methyltransferase SETMAR [Trichonephila clavipes]|nr:histone-lysine N-methyltransferase SETMAR [Trichonephila clavipes]